MNINFQIKAIKLEVVHHLFNLTDDELSDINAKRIVVDANPGYPCRISLEDAEVGESIIALSYRHHDVNSPYKASGPIFVRDNIKDVKLEVNEIPKILWTRFLSIRAYDSLSMMIEATTTKGENLKLVIQTLFLNKNIQYLHIHNASPGCFNCCVERVK